MAEENNIAKIDETSEESRQRQKLRREKYRRKCRRKTKIASFIMAFMLFLEVCTTAVYVGLYSSKSIGNSIIMSNYASEVFEDIFQRVESVSIINNLPNSVFENVITREQVNISLQSFRESLSSVSSDNVISTDEMFKKIVENTKKYLKSKEIKITDDVDANINRYAVRCVNIYENTLIFSYMKGIAQLKPFLLYGFIGMTILSFTVIIVCLIVMNAYVRYSRQILRHATYGVGACALLTSISSVFVIRGTLPLYFSKITTQYKYELVENYVSNLLKTISSASLGLFIIFLIMLSIWYYIVSVKSRGHY